MLLWRADPAAVSREGSRAVDHGQAGRVRHESPTGHGCLSGSGELQSFVMQTAPRLPKLSQSDTKFVTRRMPSRPPTRQTGARPQALRKKEDKQERSPLALTPNDANASQANNQERERGPSSNPVRSYHAPNGHRVPFPIFAGELCLPRLQGIPFTTNRCSSDIFWYLVFFEMPSDLPAGTPAGICSARVFQPFPKAALRW